MSEHWTVWCSDCLEWGPDIRRSGSFNIWKYMPRRHPDIDGDARLPAQDAWREFMELHGYHRLGLVHE